MNQRDELCTTKNTNSTLALTKNRTGSKAPVSKITLFVCRITHADNVNNERLRRKFYHKRLNPTEVKMNTQTICLNKNKAAGTRLLPTWYSFPAHTLYSLLLPYTDHTKRPTLSSQQWNHRSLKRKQNNVLLFWKGSIANLHHTYSRGYAL